MAIKMVLPGLYLKKFAENLYAQYWHLNSLILQVYLLKQAFMHWAEY